MDKALVKFVGAGISTAVMGFGRKVPVGAISNGQYMIAHLSETNPAETRQIVEGVAREILGDWKRSGLPLAVADAHLDQLPAVLDQHRVAQNFLVGGLAVAKKGAKEGRRAVVVPARRIAAEFVSLAREAQTLSRAKLGDSISFYLVERMFVHLLLQRHTLISLTNSLNTYFMKSLWMGPSGRGGMQPLGTMELEGETHVGRAGIETADPMPQAKSIAAAMAGGPASRSETRAAAPGQSQRETPLFRADEPSARVAFKPIALPQLERPLLRSIQSGSRERPSQPAAAPLPPVAAVSEEAQETQRPLPTDPAFQRSNDQAPREPHLEPVSTASGTPDVMEPTEPFVAGPATEDPQPVAAVAALIEIQSAPHGEPTTGSDAPAEPATVSEPNGAAAAVEPAGSSPASPSSGAAPGETQAPVTVAQRAPGAPRTRRVRKIIVAVTSPEGKGDAASMPATTIEAAPGPAAEPAQTETPMTAPTDISAAPAEAEVRAGVSASGSPDAAAHPIETNAAAVASPASDPALPVEAASQSEPVDDALEAVIEPVASVASVASVEADSPDTAAPLAAADPAAPLDTAALDGEPDTGAASTDAEAAPEIAGRSDGDVAAEAAAEPAVCETAAPDAPAVPAMGAAVDPDATMAPAVVASPVATGETTVVDVAEDVAVDVTAAAGLPASDGEVGAAATADMEPTAAETPNPGPERKPPRFDRPSSAVMSIVRASGGTIPIPTACAVELEQQRFGAATGDLLGAGCRGVVAVMQQLVAKAGAAGPTSDRIASILAALRSGDFATARDGLDLLTAAPSAAPVKSGAEDDAMARLAGEIGVLRAELEVACGDMATAAGLIHRVVSTWPPADPTRRLALSLLRARLLGRLVPASGTAPIVLGPLGAAIEAYRHALASASPTDGTQEYARGQLELATLLNRRARLDGQLDGLNEVSAFIDQTIDALAMYRAMDDWAEAHTQRGVVYAQLALFEEPREHLQRAAYSFNCALGHLSAQRSLATWSEARAWLGLVLKQLGQALHEPNTLAEGVSHLRAVCEADTIDLSRAGLNLGELALELADAIASLSVMRNEPGLHGTAVSCLAGTITRIEGEPGQSVAMLATMYERLGDGLWQLGGHRQDAALLDRAGRAMERAIELHLVANDETRAEARIGELERLHDYRATFVEKAQARDVRVELARIS